MLNFSFAINIEVNIEIIIDNTDDKKIIFFIKIFLAKGLIIKKIHKIFPKLPTKINNK